MDTPPMMPRDYERQIWQGGGSGDPIAHLDWPICECEGHICTSEAAYRAKYHILDRCSDPGEPVDEDGNVALKLCSPCYETSRAQTAAYVGRLSVFGRPMCLGCGAPVTCVSQVIREVKKL